MKARKKFNSRVESLDAYEADNEDFIDGDINLSSTVAVFSFGGDSLKIPTTSSPVLNQQPSLFKNPIKGTGLAPTIDGEAINHYYSYVINEQSC